MEKYSLKFTAKNAMNLRSRKKHCLLNALWTALLFTILMLVMGTCWEENDDYTIAHLFSLEGNDFSPFQWRLLSVIIHTLFQYIPVVNWWAVNCVLSVSISALSFSYVIFRRYSCPHAKILVAMVFVMLWMTAGYVVNFTRSAAVVAMGGCLLIADGMLHDKQPGWGQYMIGIVLLLYGASIRVESGLLALGFLAVTGCMWLLTDNFFLTADWFRAHVHQIGAFLVAAILFFMAWQVDMLLLTPEQRDYLEYNSLRSEIQDYSQCYSSYKTMSDNYKNAGVNEITLEALRNWFTEDTEIITKDVMAKIGKLKKNNKEVSILDEIRVNSTAILTLASILGTILVIQKKQNWYFVLLPGLTGVMISVIFFIRGRLLARVFDSIIILTLMVMVFLCGEHNGIEENKAKSKKTMDGSVRLGATACAVLLVCTIWQSTNYVKRVNVVPEHIWDFTLKKQMQQYRESAFAYIKDNNEYVFICDIIDKPNMLAESFTMWEPLDAGYVDNLFFLGGWDARHPVFVKRLSDLGIINPARALIENARVLSTYGGSRILDYLRINYNPRVTISGLFYGAGDTVNVIQYCAPIDDLMISEKKEEKIQIIDIYTQKDDMLNCLWFDANISRTENAIRDFYCNITVNQQRYTFRLHYNGGYLHSAFYGIGDAFDWEKADMRIFERTKDGRYIEFPLDSSLIE